MKKPIQITEMTEVQKIDIKSVVCSGCNGPATLDDNGLCTHCVIRPRGQVSGPTIWGQAWQMVRNALTSCGLLPRSGDAGPLTTIK